MKLTIPDFYKEQAVSLAVVISLSLIFWFAGSLPVLSDHLASNYPEKRFYLIAALFLCWVLKFIFFDITPAKKQPTTPTQTHPETEKKLQTLQGRFQGALNFLKNTVIQKHGKNCNLSELPWYLLTGPNDAGKTTLLANSKVNFILSKQFKQTDTSSDGCDWWVTRDMVMVDVPGTYFTGREKTVDLHPKKNTVATFLWNTLLGLIKQSPAKEQLKGIIIALNLPEIMRKTNHQGKNVLIHDLKKRVMDLRTQFGTQLSFHFVITKCDLLPGFTEFFSEAGNDELAHAWGITMPALQPEDKLLDVFSARFNALIKQINKQLLMRLHQERNASARHAIKDFPLHLEQLKENILHILKALALPDLCLETVYLTSATQTPAEETSSGYTHSAPGHLAHQALQIMQTPPMPTRACFIKQLVMHGFLYSSAKTFAASPVDYQWHRRAMYAGSIGVIVAAILMMGHDFEQSIKKTYALQNDLYRYQLYVQQNPQAKDPVDTLVKALPLLDSLQQAANHTTHPLSRLENILSFYSNKSEQTADAIYNKALQTIVVPEIQNDLEEYLHSANTKNPAHVYTALKAYLMLNDTNHFQAEFIANTLGKITTTPLNSEAIHQLAMHINAAFSLHAMTMQLDQSLIADTRKQLVNMPSAELAFVILKNMNENNADSTIALGTNLGRPPVFVSKQVLNRIPKMFTATHFQKIMSDEIHIAAAEALKGNWITGDVTPSINQPAADTLIAQLQNEYLEKYVDIWESQLANIQPNTPKNLLQADEMIQNLTNNNSPLLQLLQTIRQNTAFDAIMSASPKITVLNNLINNPNLQESSLYQVFVDLKQLHIYLQKILNSSAPDKNAFAAAADRMENPAQNPITAIHQLAEKNPEPLKSWLNTLANQSWDFILEKASDHIQNAWQTSVLPIYNQQIANHYPFAQNSNSDVNLEQFTRFLGHRGTLANYYLIYLRPFVNDTNTQWVWKTVDNQHLPFSDELLTRFQHAAQLQHAFFPDGDNKLSVEFTLQPVSLDPEMKTLTLNINGQQAVFQKNGKRLPRTFTWPGNYYSHNTTVSFITPKSQMVSSTLKGDWGLFRLISHSTQGVNANNALMLNITANGHSAKYLLFSNAHLNPFLSENTAELELPQTLV